MSPEHARLAILLEEAAMAHGSQSALARALGLDRSEIRHLIAGRRFVTTRQALRIEKILGVPARQLLIESAIARIDEDLARAK